MAETTDVVIVGGGAMGTSLAYHLRKQGGERVVLLEKAGIGSGATGQAAGIIRHQYSSPLLVSIAAEGRRRLGEFRDEIGEDIGFVRNGLLLLLGDRDREPALESVASQRVAGVRASIVDPDRLCDIHPLGRLESVDVGIAVFDEDAGYCDPYRVAAGYAKRAADLGADIRTGVTVTGVRLRAGRVVGVSTSQGDVSASLVVNAAGPWARGVNQMAGVAVPLSPMSLQHGVVLPEGTAAPEFPTIIDNTSEGDLFFIKPETGATMLIGMDKDPVGPSADPDSYCFDPPLDTLSEVASALCARAPFMRGGRLRNVFGALDALTPDWNPILGFAEGVEGLLLAVGFSGHGLKLAPVVGEMLASLVRCGRLSADASAQLGPARFADGGHVGGRGSVLA
ncbi:MAG: FAD-binding oxidoreductase [Thermoleophilia bacterium]|nr:FAD-binding oxidoreductase [Thermoleophilia bacterium]